MVLATACAVGFVLVGYPGRGSIALALSYLFTGWMFAGVALVAAQLAGTGRGSLGLASSTLGLAFVVRAVGDTTGSPVRWLSPLAWPASVRAFAGEQWWVLGLAGMFGAALVGAGLWLSTRRDLGSGRLVPGRGSPTGPGRPPPSLRFRSPSPPMDGRLVDGGHVRPGRCVRLGGRRHRSDDERQPHLRRPVGTGGRNRSGGLLPGDGDGHPGFDGDRFRDLSGPRPHHEESASRVEVVLATAVGRGRWLGSYLALARSEPYSPPSRRGWGTGPRPPPPPATGIRSAV